MIKISKPIIGSDDFIGAVADIKSSNNEFRRTSRLAINNENDYFLEEYIYSTKLQQELNDYIDDTDEVIDDEINYNPFFLFINNLYINIVNFCNKKK